MNTKIISHSDLSGQTESRLVHKGYEVLKDQSIAADPSKAHALQDHENTGFTQQKAGIKLEKKTPLFNVGLLKTARFGERRINLWSAAKCLQRINGKGSKIGYYFKLLFSSESSRIKYIERQFTKITPAKLHVVHPSNRPSFLLPAGHSKSTETVYTDTLESKGLLLVQPKQGVSALSVEFSTGFLGHIQKDKTELEKLNPVWKKPGQRIPFFSNPNSTKAHSLHGIIESIHKDFHSLPAAIEKVGIENMVNSLFSELSSEERADFLRKYNLIGENEKIRFSPTPAENLVAITDDHTTQYVNPRMVAHALYSELLKDSFVSSKSSKEEKNEAIDKLLLYRATRLSPKGLGNFLERITEMHAQYFSERAIENEPRRLSRQSSRVDSDSLSRESLGSDAELSIIQRAPEASAADRTHYVGATLLGVAAGAAAGAAVLGASPLLIAGGVAAGAAAIGARLLR